MKTQEPQKYLHGEVHSQMRTWYGANATVTIGPGFIHKAGFGGFLIPHPPVINWLLRKGLSENDRYILSCAHEFGHLQSAPLAMLYTGSVLALAVATHHTSLLEIIIVMISTHAVWELISELLTITSDAQLYRKFYERITTIPRIIFWGSVSVLATAGWLVVLS